jgi:hypothetical protein
MTRGLESHIDASGSFELIHVGGNAMGTTHTVVYSQESIGIPKHRLQPYSVYEKRSGVHSEYIKYQLPSPWLLATVGS